MRAVKLNRAWKHLDGTPVCESCNDDQILNRREIEGYWAAVDNAVQAMKEEGDSGGYRPGPREPMEEPCDAEGLHWCQTCGVDAKELDRLQVKWSVEFLTVDRMTDDDGDIVERQINRFEWFFCSESCIEAELDKHGLQRVLEIAVEIKKEKS